MDRSSSALKETAYLIADQDSGLNAAKLFSQEKHAGLVFAERPVRIGAMASRVCKHSETIEVASAVKSWVWSNQYPFEARTLLKALRDLAS